MTSRNKETGHIATTGSREKLSMFSQLSPFYSFSVPSAQSGAPPPTPHTHTQEVSSPHGHIQMAIS